MPTWDPSEAEMINHIFNAGIFHHVWFICTLKYIHTKSPCLEYQMFETIVFEREKWSQLKSAHGELDN